MIKILLLALMVLSLDAKKLIKPKDAMHYTFGKETQISKKNIMLKKEQAKAIQKEARVKLKSKIFRVFTAKRGDKTVGYGILINRKVRSKNAVIIYMIDINSSLKAMEIIAFNEPTEYLPSKKYKEHFKDVSTSKKLVLSKNIPTVTGATLTARTIVDGSRLAFAFYEQMLK